MERARLGLKPLILVSLVLTLSKKQYRRSEFHTSLVPQADRAVLSDPFQQAVCKCSCLSVLLIVLCNHGTVNTMKMTNLTPDLPTLKTFRLKPQLE